MTSKKPTTNHTANNASAAVYSSIVSSPISMQQNGTNAGEQYISEEDIERSSNLFSQLDAMIAAVQSESTALDSMRDKVKELDTMKEQVAMLNNRLLEADQANIQMKSALMDLQNELSASRKETVDVDNIIKPLKLELQRTKEAYSKERHIRHGLAQENAEIKEKCAQYERIIQQLQEQCGVNNRVIPEQNEAIEQLRGELSKVRQQSRSNSEQLIKRLKDVQSKSIKPAVIDNLKGEVRRLANMLMEVCNGPTDRFHNGTITNNVGGASQNGYANSSYVLETSYNPDDYNDLPLDDLMLDDLSETNITPNPNEISGLSNAYEYSAMGDGSAISSNHLGTGAHIGGNANATQQRYADPMPTGGKGRRKSKSHPRQHSDAAMGGGGEAMFSIEPPIDQDSDNQESNSARNKHSRPNAQKKKKDSLPKI